MSKYVAWISQLGLLLLLLSTSMLVHAAGAPANTSPYFELNPPFVVNLKSDEDIKFLQVSAQVRVADGADRSQLEKHLPAVRHALIMLLSNKTEEDVRSRKGKEMLRTEALEVIVNVLQDPNYVVPASFAELHTDQDDKDKDKKQQKADAGHGSLVEDVFFTSFIIQ